MEKRSIQIDVLGSAPGNKRIVECQIYIDGRCCVFYTSKEVYENLCNDGIFIRDGKTRDSAGVLNTTNVFYEKQ